MYLTPGTSTDKQLTPPASPARQLTTRGDLDVEIDYSQLERLRVLGRGSYGEVALHRWRPGSRWPPGTPRAGEPRTGEVAVKVLLPEVESQKSAVADLKAELAILSRLSHSCLVALVGAGTRTDRKTGAHLLFIALEAVTGGDLLHKVLYAMVNPKAYRDADCVRWAHDVSRGLHYLHTRKPRVIHRDLKLENILLDAHTWQAKLTDFGLVKTIVAPTRRRKSDEPPPEPGTPGTASSSMSSVATDGGGGGGGGGGGPSSGDLPTSSTPGGVTVDGSGSGGAGATYVMTGGTGSYKYMAPETYAGLPANERVDTYSLSICLWELMSRRPLLFMRTKAVSTGKAHGRMEYTPKMWAHDAAQGTRPEQPEEWPAPLRELMAECWAHEPAKRPSQKTVMERLEKMLQPELYTYPGKGERLEGAAPGCSCSLQ